MLILAIILLVLGAALVAIGRRHEVFFVYAGYIAFGLGVVAAIVWLLDRGDVETDALILLRR